MSTPAATPNKNTANDPANVGSRRAATEERTTLERIWPWVLRVCWLGLPFTVVAILRDALADSSSAVRVTGLIIAWCWWGIGLLATVVAHPYGLTLLRTAVGPIVVATLWSLARDTSPVGLRVASILCALTAVAAVMISETGQWCVNGPAYANERRFLLRPPVVVQYVFAPVAAALFGASTIAGPLLIAARSYLVGAVLSVLGVVVVVIAMRALHALARRFIVFVPAGLVLHDYDSLREPVLFLKRSVEGLRAAPAGSDSLDLTSNASGLAVEVLLHEKIEVTRVRNSRDKLGENGATGRFLVVPTLPGRLLRMAKTLGFATEI